VRGDDFLAKSHLHKEEVRGIGERIQAKQATKQDLEF
jgi:hypothetical protein